MIKKILLIVYTALILPLASPAADTVNFTWGYGSDPISNFRIYTGATPHVGNEVYIIPVDARRAGVPVPDLHYAWITAYGMNGLESLPSPAPRYRPVTVELVIQQSKDLREWGGRVAVFVFRLPDAVAGNIEQRLNITRTEVQVRVNGVTYRAPIPTGVGKKFFRSYVAVVP